MWIVIERNTDNLKDAVKNFEDINGNGALPIQGDELQAIQNAIIKYQHNEAVKKAIKKYGNHL
jgi:HAMP domain-containing protein